MGQSEQARSAFAAFQVAMAARWQETLDELNVIALGLDREGNVQFVNTFFCELTGHDRDAALGKHWFDTFLPERDRMDIRTTFREVIENEFHKRYENPIITATGEERVIRWFNTRLRDRDGGIAGTFSIGEDVTAARRAQTDREKLIVELQAALKNVPMLRDYLPMCASCKKVREDDGYWSEVASYILKHANVRVTHGVCPECARALYGADVGADDE